MAKVTLNPILEGLRGKVGDLVLKRYGDGTIISPKPTVTGEPTEGQVAHRDRLVDAIVYGTAGMADPEAKAFYDEATRARKSSTEPASICLPSDLSTVAPQGAKVGAALDLCLWLFLVSGLLLSALICIHL